VPVEFTTVPPVIKVVVIWSVPVRRRH
jgi:hypothetical protein